MIIGTEMGSGSGSPRLLLTQEPPLQWLPTTFRDKRRGTDHCLLVKALPIETKSMQLWVNVIKIKGGIPDLTGFTAYLSA
ncbi:MAG TPA: hypothetical protein VM537_19765 [Anaerolineae bacterium]|nr:hypothetical protein [Anaerolineae bacterium]